MCVSPIAAYARYMRSSVLDVSNQDYILTAEAKGVSEFHIVTRHMPRNSILPCITMICVSVAAIFSGSFIIETIFAIPGLGKYFISAINDRDYFVVLGLNIIFTGIYVISMLISDILLTLVDPRIRTSFE
jgi:oligopeptide transport system permease protein